MKVQKKDDSKVISYRPFLGEEEIKLSVAIVKKFLTVPTKSGKYPTDEDCVRFMMLCQARKLNPWEGDAFLVGYDTKGGPQFSLITSHQALMKRAVADADYRGIQSGVIVQDTDGKIHELEGDFVPPSWELLGGWAKVYINKFHVPVSERLNTQPFDKGYGLWRENKAGMIVKCAEASALRKAFPAHMANMYTSEEMAAIASSSNQSDPSDVSSIYGKLDEVQSKLESLSGPIEPDKVQDVDDGSAESDSDNEDAFDVYCADWQDQEDAVLIKKYMELREKVAMSAKGYAKKNDIKKNDGELPATFSDLLDADRKAALMFLYDGELRASKGQSK